MDFLKSWTEDQLDRKRMSIDVYEIKLFASKKSFQLI